MGLPKMETFNKTLQRDEVLKSEYVFHTSKMERRPGQILEGEDLSEDSARQANLEAVCSS